MTAKIFIAQYITNTVARLCHYMMHGSMKSKMDTSATSEPTTHVMLAHTSHDVHTHSPHVMLYRLRRNLI